MSPSEPPPPPPPPPNAGGLGVGVGVGVGVGLGVGVDAGGVGPDVIGVAHAALPALAGALLNARSGSMSTSMRSTRF